MIAQSAHMHLKSERPSERKIWPLPWLQELKQQLETVEGEIMAGNNNPELLKEVHKLLWTMNSVELIAGNTALKHFKDIKRMYF